MFHNRKFPYGQQIRRVHTAENLSKEQVKISILLTLFGKKRFLGITEAPVNFLPMSQLTSKPYLQKFQSDKKVLQVGFPGSDVETTDKALEILGLSKEDAVVKKVLNDIETGNLYEKMKGRKETPQRILQVMLQKAKELVVEEMPEEVEA